MILRILLTISNSYSVHASLSSLNSLKIFFSKSAFSLLLEYYDNITYSNTIVFEFYVVKSYYRKRKREEVRDLYFQYGNTEVEYLKSRDKILGDLIDKIGHIEREIDTDLFSAVIHHIVGQQISTKAQETIWKRLKEFYTEINAETILSAGIDQLQSLGMTFRKAEYITDFSRKVHTGEFHLQGIVYLSDTEAIHELVTLKGIGKWTAEMILLFCLQRPNIFSFDDLAIQRGIRMVYHHRKVDRKLFEKYRRRFTPYCSVASLYFWAAAGGAVPGLRDYAPKGKGGKQEQCQKSKANSK